VLEHWLSTLSLQVRPSTQAGYRAHVVEYLIPHLGRLRLPWIAGWPFGGDVHRDRRAAYPGWAAGDRCHGAARPGHAASGIERGGS
jgi:hypothetical protein